MKRILALFLIILCFSAQSCKKCYKCTIPACYACYIQTQSTNTYCGNYPSVPQQQCVASGGTWSITADASVSNYCYQQGGLTSYANSFSISQQESDCTSLNGTWSSN
jgi:hypothetical protein